MGDMELVVRIVKEEAAELSDDFNFVRNAQLLFYS